MRSCLSGVSAFAPLALAATGALACADVARVRERSRNRPELSLAKRVGVLRFKEHDGQRPFPPQPQGRRRTTEYPANGSSSQNDAVSEEEIYGQAARLISTSQLNASLRFHTWPINLVVYQEPSEGLLPGRSHLVEGFTLRCIQRFSLPNVATRHCHWRDNRYTRGPSNPVLSY